MYREICPKRIHIILNSLSPKLFLIVCIIGVANAIMSNESFSFEPCACTHNLATSVQPDEDKINRITETFKQQELQDAPCYGAVLKNGWTGAGFKDTPDFMKLLEDRDVPLSEVCCFVENPLWVVMSS